MPHDMPLSEFVIWCNMRKYRWFKMIVAYDHRNFDEAGRAIKKDGLDYEIGQYSKLYHSKVETNKALGFIYHLIMVDISELVKIPTIAAHINELDVTYSRYSKIYEIDNNEIRSKRIRISLLHLDNEVYENLMKADQFGLENIDLKYKDFVDRVRNELKEMLAGEGNVN